MTQKGKETGGRPFVFSMSNDQCVWGRAGVIKETKCINAFDCLGCSLDKRVMANYEKKKREAGEEMVRSPRLMLMMKQGKCRHMLSGRISYSLCSHGYNCVKCPYDQMVEESGYLPNLREPQCDQTSGFDVARDYYYFYGHTWARVEYGGRVRVGLDDFALRLFGPQDEIVMPGLGEAVDQGQPLVKMNRSGKVAPALSPLKGKVVAVNHKIFRDAGIANDSPYQHGWLLLIQPTGLRRSLKDLFFGDESLAWIDDEASRLRDIFGETTGYRMAASGGEAVKDIYGAAPEIGWDRLVEEFLL